MQPNPGDRGKWRASHDTNPARRIAHLCVGGAERGDLQPLLQKLEIRRCGLHAFRHANGTLMDRLGVPLKVRQQRLGHSDPRLTMNTYTHMASADDERIAEQLGEMLDVVGRKHENEPSKEKGPAVRQALLN